MHEKVNRSDCPDQTLLSRLESLRQSRTCRDRTGLFVIEGIRQFIQACDAGFEFVALFVSPVLLRQGIGQKLVRRLSAAGVRKVVLTPEQFRALSTTEHASGIAAIVRQRWITLRHSTTSAGIGWLVIDSIRSGGNLGTIIRTAEAVGACGIIFAGPAVDPYDPAVIRASMGGIFHIPLIRTSPRELGFWLAEHDVNLIGLAPQARRLWTELPSGKRYAIALGDERTGLSPPLRRLCDGEVRLPMTGRADSLNVAVAAGVMIYELVRQRSV